jgi:hypothetical protein
MNQRGTLSAPVTILGLAYLASLPEVRQEPLRLVLCAVDLHPATDALIPDLKNPRDIRVAYGNAGASRPFKKR